MPTPNHRPAGVDRDIKRPFVRLPAILNVLSPAALQNVGNVDFKMAAQYKHLLSVFLPLLGLLLYPVWCLPSVAPSTFTFNIFPKDGNDIAQETAINQTLAGFKIDPKSILFFKYAGFGVFMWKAPLTQDQATNLRSQSAVRNLSRESILAESLT